MAEPMTDERLEQIRSQCRLPVTIMNWTVEFDALADAVAEIDRLRADLERTTEIMKTAHQWLEVLQTESRHPAT